MRRKIVIMLINLGLGLFIGIYVFNFDIPQHLNNKGFLYGKIFSHNQHGDILFVSFIGDSSFPCKLGNNTVLNS